MLVKQCLAPGALLLGAMLAGCGEADPEKAVPPPASAAGLAYRVVDVVGADGSCEAGEMLLSAYCFSDAGRSISASGPALQPDANGRIVATCLTGGRNLRLFCVKQ